MKQCYVFDLDGTLADDSHRQHFLTGDVKKWQSYYEGMGKDILFRNVYKVCSRLSSHIIILTGRPEEYRTLTERWLAHNCDNYYDMLIMRPTGNHEPSGPLKVKQLQELEASGYEIMGIFEDRPEVADAMVEAGYTVFQVRRGK